MQDENRVKYVERYKNSHFKKFESEYECSSSQEIGSHIHILIPTLRYQKHVVSLAVYLYCTHISLFISRTHNRRVGNIILILLKIEPLISQIKNK